MLFWGLEYWNVRDRARDLSDQTDPSDSPLATRNSQLSGLKSEKSGNILDGIEDRAVALLKPFVRLIAARDQDAVATGSIRDFLIVGGVADKPHFIQRTADCLEKNLCRMEFGTSTMVVQPTDEGKELSNAVLDERLLERRLLGGR